MKTYNSILEVIITLLFAGGVLLLAGCQQEPVDNGTPTPFDSPTNSITNTVPPTTLTAVSPTSPPLPDGEEMLRRSQEAAEAQDESGIKGVFTYYRWPDAPPFTVEQTICQRMPADSETEAQYDMTWLLPGDLTQRISCNGSGNTQTCYTQIAAQPWFRDFTLEGAPTWLEGRADVISSAIVTAGVESVEDGSLKVVWTRENWSNEGLTILGESWLERDTFLPLREIYTSQQGNTLSSEGEIDYVDCQPDGRPDPWPAPTVTPFPTVVPPAGDFQIKEETAPLPGIMYVPEGEGPFPAVLVLHGSEGGVRATDGVAQRLARSGMVAFAYCYFGCLETPYTLEDIEIEGVQEAVAYLQSRPDTYNEKVGVLGFSRGAELALIVGGLDETVGAVVSSMGAPWVHRSLDSEGDAWLHQGQPLPFYEIPVETIQGPVLLMHGQEDTLWPVSFSYIIAERLAANNRAFELVVYPHRGHELTIAPRDVLNRTAVFLHQNLTP